MLSVYPDHDVGAHEPGIDDGTDGETTLPAPAPVDGTVILPAPAPAPVDCDALLPERGAGLGVGGQRGALPVAMGIGGAGGVDHPGRGLHGHDRWGEPDRGRPQRSPCAVTGAGQGGHRARAAVRGEYVATGGVEHGGDRPGADRDGLGLGEPAVPVGGHRRGPLSVGRVGLEHLTGVRVPALTACASSAAPPGVSVVEVAAATAGVIPNGSSIAAAATSGSHTIRERAGPPAPRYRPVVPRGLIAFAAAVNDSGGARGPRCAP